MLGLSAADVTDQVHWFRLKVDADKGWLGKGNGISVPTGSKLNKMMFLSDLLITHVGPHAKDCSAQDIEAAAGEKVHAPLLPRRAAPASPTFSLATRLPVRRAGSEVGLLRTTPVAWHSRDARLPWSAAVQGELGGRVLAELGLVVQHHAHR